MKRPVVWADTARSDYLRIIRFIAQENPDAAERVADDLDGAVVGLGEMAIGRPGRVSGTYEKVVSGLPYIIAYAITVEADHGETIAVLHVIHGARDWPEGGWPEP